MEGTGTEMVNQKSALVKTVGCLADCCDSCSA